MPITTDELDDRIIAIEVLMDAIKARVEALEAAPAPSPPGTQVILPIIGFHIIYTVPTP